MKSKKDCKKYFKKAGFLPEYTFLDDQRSIPDFFLIRNTVSNKHHSAMMFRGSFRRLNSQHRFHRHKQAGCDKNGWRVSKFYFGCFFLFETQMFQPIRRPSRPKSRNLLSSFPERFYNSTKLREIFYRDCYDVDL